MSKAHRINPAVPVNGNETPIEATDLINIPDAAPAVFHFKNTKLNEYSAQIAACAHDMNTKAREVAMALGHVLSSKCYEDDGFKSVGEFAENTFGIKKSQAYRMANTAKRFFIDKNLTAENHPELLTAPISNLAEIAKLTDQEIDDAISAGVISPDSTQKRMREAAQSAALPKIDKTPYVCITMFPTWAYEMPDGKEPVVLYEFNDKLRKSEVKETLSGFYFKHVQNEDGTVTPVDTTTVIKIDLPVKAPNTEYYCVVNTVTGAAAWMTVETETKANATARAKESNRMSAQIAFMEKLYGRKLTDEELAKVADAMQDA